MSTICLLRQRVHRALSLHRHYWHHPQHPKLSFSQLPRFGTVYLQYHGHQRYSGCRLQHGLAVIRLGRRYCDRRTHLPVWAARLGLRLVGGFYHSAL